MSLDPTGALQNALAAEHAVVWGYGVVGAQVVDDARAGVQAVEQVHRARRDTTEALLRGKGAVPTTAQASYELPFPVTDQATALQLAVTLESGAAAAWHFVLGETDDPVLRQTALVALNDAAVRAVQWRLAAGVSPASVAFPGQ